MHLLWVSVCNSFTLQSTLQRISMPEAFSKYCVFPVSLSKLVEHYNKFYYLASTFAYTERYCARIGILRLKKQVVQRDSWDIHK